MGFLHKEMAIYSQAGKGCAILIPWMHTRIQISTTSTTEQVDIDINRCHSFLKNVNQSVFCDRPAWILILHGSDIWSMEISCKRWKCGICATCAAILHLLFVSHSFFRVRGHLLAKTFNGRRFFGQNFGVSFSEAAELSPLDRGMFCNVRGWLWDTEHSLYRG